MKTKLKVVFVAMVVGLLFTLPINALATSTPTGECGLELNWDGSYVERCRYTLDDMGAFDVNGIWVWDTDFETRAVHWFLLDPVNQPWRIVYAPYEDGGETYIPILWKDQSPPGEDRLYLVGDFGAGGVINFECITCSEEPPPPPAIDMETYCPCDNGWKNHGKYVRCVSHTCNDLVDQGVIIEDEADVFVSTAARSTCGK